MNKKIKVILSILGSIAICVVGNYIYDYLVHNKSPFSSNVDFLWMTCIIIMLGTIIYLLVEISNNKGFKREARQKELEFPKKLLQIQIPAPIITFGNLTNQNALANIAIDNLSSDSVRRMAIEKLTDQNILSEVATDNLSSESIRRMAFEKLTDTNIIADVSAEIAADNLSTESIRRMAIERLTDQYTLSNVANDNLSSESIRRMAIKRLTDCY